MPEPRIDLRKEIGALTGGDESGTVLGRTAAAEAKLAAVDLMAQSRRINETAEATIDAFRTRLDDPRLGPVSQALEGRLVATAETNLGLMSELTAEMRRTVAVAGRINPGFPLAVTPELDQLQSTIDMFGAGLDPFINPRR